MTRAALLIVVALAGCGSGTRRLSSSAPPASARSGAPDERAEMAARLAGATFGRTPGRPTSCVDVADLRSSRALGPGLVLFDGQDGRQWVTRAQNCPALRYGYSVRLKAVAARLCRGNEVEVLDGRGTPLPGPCAVGDFLTYEPRR